MDEELKTLNVGLAVIEPVEGYIICDVCQRVILLYHLRTVGRRGGELDVCNVCRWHLNRTTCLTLKGKDEDGRDTTVSFKSTNGPRCALYYIGRVSPPNATDKKASANTKRLRLDEENPARTKNNRFKHSNFFSLPKHIPQDSIQPPSTQHVDATTVTPSMDPPSHARARATVKQPLATTPPYSVEAAIEEVFSVPLAKPKHSSEIAVGTKRHREEPPEDTPFDLPILPVTPSLIEFFNSFEAKYKVAGEEAPTRTLINVGVEDNPIVPLTRGAFAVPSLNCYVIKGRVTRCISVDVVPSAATDTDVYISVLGQHLRFQMDIWRCSYSEGCLGEPQLIHQLNVGKTEPLGCSWVPLPLMEGGRLGVCTLLRSRNLSTMAPPSSSEGAKIINPMLIGLCCLEKPAKKIEWWRGATTLDEAKLFVAMEDGSLEVYRPTKVDSKLNLTFQHRIVSGYVDQAPISTCRLSIGSVCAWGCGHTLFSHVMSMDDTSSIVMPHSITCILCYVGGTIVGLSNGSIFHVSHKGDQELLTSMPSDVSGLSQIGPHQVVAICSSGVVSVLDVSCRPPVCQNRLSVRTVKAIGSEPPTITISQPHSGHLHSDSDVTMATSNSTQSVGALFTGGSIVIMACNTTH